MAAVPQRILNWLYGVLTRDHYDPRLTYQDPNRAYHDVANALAQYPTLAPRTEVYTYETGFSALLLQLSGTLPVSFRGTVYRFPVTLWIPTTYPREPPIVYVTPTPEMAVRVGQHVTLEGRVYHHYLAHWAEAWERSSLVDFLFILREVFAKEPPVRYKQQAPVQQQPQQAQVQAPPPLPPLPPELESSPRTQSPSVAPMQRPTPVPPPPPPKPGQTPDPGSPSQQPSSAGRYNTPPPLPPLPPKEQDLRRLSFQQQSGINIPGSRPSQYSPEHSRPPLQPNPSQYQHPQHAPPPATRHHPGQAYAQPMSNTPTVPSQDLGHMPHQPIPAQTPSRQTPLPHPAYSQRPSQQAPTQPIAQPQHQQPLPVQQRPKSETPDLLTSPFELELPSFAPTGPAPPIPPNPEKDALLQAVSKTLSETLQTNIAQSESAAHSLLSQSHSLHAAIATLQGEISSLNALNATLQSNTSILQQTLHRADGVIGDAQTRISSLSGAPSSGTGEASTVASGLPPIDEVLVAPTVVGKQLYDLVAEERGIQQAIYALQAALVKGVIGVETWSRHTRGLAREAYLKRALIRKIGKGMGLEVEEAF
ncbi:putative endosomal sorting complex protein TSG101 [Aspergillus saccharolyticus JOP 1030-1]|uniref:UEV-domain-containing protein n=1 Tax=Aspergillus saccharolyticus JOP 1030-1 TaxID=1450539 RepID=A0A319AQD7_9EURO|nr:UEV-domain-containing protein [Aspergillus saccharolyticus JOP 1030-1]PYH48622.1 UEV-domain-containing protein [Aspergillus saccharolyticus JOP 1030-1]